ncbi:MAG: HAMP domain-containing protein [Rubrivivax sp.]|nr:HAMP domain-containing protein [Rubrivivax sp.]
MEFLVAPLRRFTIRVRMIGAVAMVLGMFAVIGLIGVAGGLKIQALSEDFMAHAVQELETVGQVRQHLAAVRLHEKQMVIDYEDGARVAQHRQAWLAEIAATKKALAAMLEGEEDADNALAQEATQRLDAYAERSEPVLKNIQEGQYDNARAADRMLGRAKDEVAVAEERVEQIAAIVSAEAAQMRTDLQSLLGSGVVVFGGVLLVILAVVVPLTLANSRSITAPIAYAVGVAERIAAGDLSKPVSVQGQDEASALVGALQRMQASLQQVVGDVHASSQSIRLASTEVATGNQDLSGRTEQTASNLQQAASSLEQLTGTVGTTADSARTANQLAASAADVAQRGGAVVSQVVSTMDEIHGASRKIADIIAVIDGIAFQTNILALNAAVEAARAGEQGRGFAVVAGEVRSLAQRSAEAAREIKGLIQASVEKVDAGSRLVADAGSTMNEIVASVQRVSDIIGEISAAASEQSSGIAQVNGAVTDLDRMTQQNAALVEQSAAAAESLKDQAQKLAEVVGAFRLQPA